MPSLSIDRTGSNKLEISLVAGVLKVASLAARNWNLEIEAHDTDKHAHWI